MNRITLWMLYGAIALRSATIYGTIQVVDVTAEQIEGEKKVSITYDLENQDGLPIMVSLEVTSVGEYWIESNFVTGDVGMGVTQGFNKKIIWDAGSEWPSELFLSVRVRVRVDDGQTEEPLEAPEGFSYIPAGSLGMGSPESERTVLKMSANPIDASDEVLHIVNLTRSFFMSQSEVSFAEWIEVRNWGLENGYTDLPVGQSGGLGIENTPNPPSHPASLVSWFDAVKWLNARSERDRLTPCYTYRGEVYRTGDLSPRCEFDADGYRLPTESEWEFACRAGSRDAFYTGDITQPDSFPVDPNLDRSGWYEGNSGGNSHTVGDPSKEANEFGLRDMHGNVFEWCWDWYGPYAEPAMIDPTGESTGQFRVIRGGAFHVSATRCRSAYRGKHIPNQTSSSIGFRITRTVVR